MKKSRIALMLVISLVMALGAALLAKNWLQERMEVRAATRPDSKTVVAATREIPFGQSVDAADVHLIELPKDASPKGSFQRVDEVVGWIATQTIYPGEVILDKRIGKNMGGSALAAVVDKGKRAISVRVNDVVGVAGFLLPGNRVDVVASKRGGTREVSSSTILTDIKVLAVDQIASPQKDEPVIVRAVTLEVTPSQAEELVKATREGEVQLTLRNPLDKEPKQVAKAPEPKPQPRPTRVVRRPSHVYVEVIRGTSQSSEKVKD